MVNNPIGIGKMLMILVMISFAVSYFYLYSTNSKHKDSSKAKYWIITVMISLSLMMLLAGTLFWKSTSHLSPSSQEQSKQLESTLRNILPYIFIGLVLMIASFSLLSRHMDDNRKWLLLAVAWFLFTFYSVNATFYSLKISPFRAWMLLAIPVALLSAEAIIFIYSMAKSFAGKYPALILIVLLLFAVHLTSLKQKIAVNTSSTWPVGGFWTSNEEIGGYLWLKDNIPNGANVFTYANNGPIIGYDKFTCHWCQDVRDYQRKQFNETAQQTHAWLKSKDYRYITIDGQTAQRYGANETNAKAQSLIESGRFKPVFGNNGMIILEIL
jgi:hypothetical protein